MPEVTPTLLQGFLVPFPMDEENIWEAQSTYTQRSPIPGQAVPLDSGVALSLRTSGTMEASESQRIRVQRAGDPGHGGAAVIWKYTDDGDNEWRGHDALAISSWESLIWTDGSGVTASALDPHILSLPDGRVALVWQETSSLPLYAVRFQVRELDGIWSSAVTLTTSSALPSSSGFYPCLCLEPDETALLIAHWDAEQEGQVRIHRAKLSDLTTWSVAARGALQSPLSATSYSFKRLRLAALPGQYLMLAELVDSGATSWDNLHIQWASLGGMRFHEVERSDGSSDYFPFHRQDIVAHGGVFVVTYISGVSETTCKRLGNAFESLTAAASTILQNGFATATSSGTAFVLGENALWDGDDGALFTAGMDSPSGTCWMGISNDGGATWENISSLNPLWFSSNDTLTRPANFSGCVQRGRHVIAHNHIASPGNEDGSLSIAYVGGFSTVTLDYWLDASDQLPWFESWLPFDKPQDTRWDANGAGTETLTDGYLELNGAMQRYYGRATNPPTGGPADGITIRATVRCRAGGATATTQVGIRLTTGDGAEGYQVAIRFQNSPPRIAVWDAVAGTQIGADIVLPPGTWDAPLQILAALRGDRFALWYRENDTSEDRVWIAGPTTSSLTDAGGASASSNNIEWGHIIFSTAESEWTEFHYNHAIGAVVAGLDPGFINPDDLRGKFLARRGYGGASGGGLRLEANSGPGREGDEFQVDVDYRYPLRRIFADISKSSTAPYRMAGDDPATPVDAAAIAFALNPDNPGIEEEEFLSDILGLYLGGVNWRSATLRGRDVGTGLWDTVATIDLADGLSFTGVTRYGRTLSPGGGGDHPYLHHHECAGWTAILNSTILRRVKTNSAGVWDSAHPGKRATLELEGIDGTEPTTGLTLHLVPTSALLLVNLLGERYSALQLSFASQRTLTGYLEMARCWLGAVHLFGQSASWGRQIDTEAQTAVRQRLDGLSRTKRLGNALRTWRFGWVDGTIDLGQLWGESPDPSYFKATTTSGARAAAAEMDVPYQVEGILRQQDGPVRPIVYIPGFAPGPPDTVILNRRQQFVASELTSAVSWEQILGDENQGAPDGEQVRMSAITGRELP